MEEDKTPATATPDTPPAATAAPSAAPRARLAPTAFAVAALALALCAWQWIDSRGTLRSMEQQLARRLAEAETLSRDSRRLADEAHEAVRESQTKLGVLEGRLAESQSQQVALEAMYQELSRSRDEAALADLEQTLIAASQQLALAGNVKAALIALQAVDSRLARLDRPQLASLRKVVARDIERLKQAPFVDVVGLSARLDALAAGVDAWPLAIDLKESAESARAVPAAAPEPNAWLRFWRELVAELRALVRIENIERAEAPLVTPAQAFFLRENLKLRLLSARIALLARDDKSYKADLEAARGWLARYYDGRNAAVAAAAATLRTLSEGSISIEVPDINASLEAVRNHRLMRERTR